MIKSRNIGNITGVNNVMKSEIPNSLATKSRTDFIQYMEEVLD
jgi:hypothetical protein